MIRDQCEDPGVGEDIPSFAKVSKTWDDICLFVQTLIYPSGDLYKVGIHARQFVDEENRWRMRNERRIRRDTYDS
jgi:hypothetical protein